MKNGLTETLTGGLVLWADTLPTSVDNFNVDYHHYILCFDFAL